jgi:hypothetical protein
MTQEKKQNKQLLDEALSRLKRYSSSSRHNYRESLSGIYWRLAKVAQFLEIEMEKDCEKYKYNPKKFKCDDDAANDFDQALSLVCEANSGFLTGCSAGHEYWRIKKAFLFVESKLVEIDGEDQAKKIIEIHGGRVTRKKDDSGVDDLKTLSDNENDTLMTYAVIGAMATTGGDAEEAARLLGVAVEFINERF